MRSRTSRVLALLAPLALAGLSGLAACGHDAPPQAATAPAPTATVSATDAGAPTPPAKPRAAWMVRSDANAQVVMDIEVQFSPESGSQLGVESADTKTVDLTPGFRARYAAALTAGIADLQARRAKETDPNVIEDLEILMHSAELNRRQDEVEARDLVPLWPVARMIFGGAHALLDDQVKPERRAAALTRLRRYAGLEPGTTPLAVLAKQDMLASKATTYPYKQDVEKAISTSQTLLDGVSKLLQKYNLTDGQAAMNALHDQLVAYDAFLKDTILPKARTNSALPPAVYEVRLESAGVDLPASEIASMAHKEFLSIQDEMKGIAAQIAKAKNLPSADYRDVIKVLKKDQIVGDAILPHYKEQLGLIEEIIRQHDLVTLPDRPARMRLASAAESAQQPAPHMVPPRLVGNTGEEGEFVLPLSIPAPSGSKEAESKYDDFTSASASWTLTAHELRPGHELQFDTMVERGITLARAHYAFNSTNAEGWGLYSEAMILPYMPLEGALVSLQYRLQRAARAFLDPELQTGKWTFDTARAFLEKEVCLSHAFATAEIERYTFLMPGQATSYFYGYVRLRALRKEAENRLGDKFVPKAFHDAILDQGLLPPDLMRRAVLTKLGVSI